MRRLLFAAVFAAAIAFSCSRVTAADAEANAGVRNRAACPAGKVVVNVTQEVVNDADSGVAGNNWALDQYVRHIAVVQTGPHQFCAVVRYEGVFTTFAGPSPGGAAAIDDGIDGTFQGGYVSTEFAATLKEIPIQPRRGNIGVFDYVCDQFGDCPGRIDWTALYFDDVNGFDFAWWGWIYHAGRHGTWINASDGNFGDITN